MTKPEGRDDPIELDIPDGVANATQAVELIRAWIADGGLMVSLNADAFGDRMADWGRLLAQVGHHLANAAALQGQMTEQDALKAIRQGFDAMLPVSEPTMSGKLRGRVTH